MGLPQTLIGLAALTLAGCASMESSPPEAAKAEVTGSVFYRERIMLAPPGVVTVTPNVTAPPINFALAYDPAQIIPNHTYSVSARIEVDGKLRFITDTHYPVITRGAPNHVEMLAVGVPQN